MVTIILTINILVLIFSITLQMGFIFYNERNFLQKRLLLTAKVVSLQTIASIEFLDPIAAKENLLTLQILTEIQKACIYDITGTVFAFFSTIQTDNITIDSPLICPSIYKRNTMYQFDKLYIYTDIISDNNKIGTLYFEYDLTSLYESLRNILYFNLIITLLGLLLSYFISSYLQRLISKPIISLGEITRNFTRTHNYNLRAIQHDNDELGELVNDFNNMIEEMEKHEIKLNKVIKDLRNSNEELERFAYICSHDLQEPLRMISNYTQLLSQQYDAVLDENAEEYMGYITGGAARMRDLINDILTYSRIGYTSDNITLINIQDIIDNMLKTMASSIKERNAIITVDPMPVIHGYKVLITQVFQNLLVNALKFCKDRQPIIHIGCKRISQGWEFSVQDNGIGINQLYYNKIFEIFKRLNRSEEYEGTGIGLSICKKAVEYHGGNIWVSSIVGEGSTFFFTIPDHNLTTSK